MLRKAAKAAAVAALWACPMAAEEVWITPDQPDVRLVLKGDAVVIARHADQTGVVATLALACPPHCIQPLQAAPGVATVGALEVIGFLQAEVAGNAGYLVDVRLPAAFAAQRLPGAVNVPGVTLAAENPALRDILLALGAQDLGGVMDFAAAPVLAIYGEGPVHDEAAAAVRSLMAAGYPAERLRYFRGGLQEWLQFGLTVSGSAEEG